MDVWVECDDCGESYPSGACKDRCPSCGLKRGAQANTGRKAKVVLKKFRDDWSV